MIPSNIQTDMIALFDKTLQYRFHKKTYETHIQELMDSEQPLLKQIAEVCDNSAEDMDEIAAYIPQYVSEQLGTIQSKRKKELFILDLNMNMVSYFVPLMGKIPSLQAKTFTEKMVSAWNERMPEYKIGHSTAEEIQGGFKKGLCYITTAVCRSLDKPDDCHELTMLREYRDEYLVKTPEGKAIVEDYYNIAPTIVKKIDRQENAAEVYKELWQQYLNPCVQMIEKDQQEDCGELYKEMVQKLEKKYMYNN